MKLYDNRLLKDITSFMEDIYGSFDPVLINEMTRLEEDLRITGDEACDFIVKYGKAFNVDVLNFLAADYFSPEGYDILSNILESFGLKRKNIKKDFTVGDLIKGIQAGKLDEEVLNRAERNDI